MDAIQHWSTLLRESADRTLCASQADRMRAARLTFGGRLLCPFLRPFFLTLAEEARIAHAAETLWRLGERVARVALERPALMDDLGLSDAERRLASIDPGCATTSTAARADSFILPASLQFAEYNAESPAGPGYAQRLSEPRDLSFERDRLIADGAPVDLVYRRVLISDIVARADDCRALVDAYSHRAVAVANTLRCKIPHKKAFFAVLTDERHLELFND